MTREDKARYVSAMFGSIVPRYDLMNAIMTLGQDHVWRTKAVRLAAPPSGGLALDLATGTGDLALALAACRTHPRVVAVDFSPPMLAAAQAKARRRGLDHRVKFVLGDVTLLPLRDAAFDCVTMGFGTRNVADLSKLFAAIHRVLRPGGRFVNLDLTPWRSGVLGSLLDAYFFRILPSVGALVTGNRDAYTYLPHSVRDFMPAITLAEMMRAEGFRAVSYRRDALGTIATHVAVR